MSPKKPEKYLSLPISILTVWKLEISKFLHFLKVLNHGYFVVMVQNRGACSPDLLFSLENDLYLKRRSLLTHFPNQFC